jgi:hypothetical protein
VTQPSPWIRFLGGGARWVAGALQNAPVESVESSWAYGCPSVPFEPLRSIVPDPDEY